MYKNKIIKPLIGILIGLSSLNSVALASDPFSFLVIGDTRTEPYLSGGKNETAKIIQVLDARFNVGSENISLTFDSLGKAVVSAEILNEGVVETIIYKDGWPQMITKTKKNKDSKVIMRISGRHWVNDQIISEMRKGALSTQNGTSFIVHGGDIPLFGFQGITLATNPYYQLFNKELLMQLPIKPNVSNLPGNLFATVGNHATWMDEDIVGFTQTLPWLKELGLTSSSRTYSYVHNNCSFIFLDSGGYRKSSTGWTSIYPTFEKQMNYLKLHLDDAVKNKRDHIFVIYHKPSFNQIGHDPLPSDQNPHMLLKQYSDELSIFVFNSHVHTTEHYLVDGINYQVIGGGGAPQKFATSNKPSTQKELYWNSKSRFEEYNYLKVEVDSSNITGTINRFRPLESLTPFSTKIIFSK